jgi:hypothetical protein
MPAEERVTRRDARNFRFLAIGQQEQIGDSGVSRSAGGAPSLLAAHSRSWFFTGSVRTRLPVAAKIALQSAGGIGGTPGSPTPPMGLA